eukprot:s642_g13.t1
MKPCFRTACRSGAYGSWSSSLWGKLKTSIGESRHGELSREGGTFYRLETVKKDDDDNRKTIDVAGRQRMLTQRMSKEFLQVALDIDAADNRGRMLGSINLFNVTLYQLINGDSATGIVGTPNHLVGSGLDDVVSLWVPFSQLLLDNVDTIRDASGHLGRPLTKSAISSKQA